MSEMTLREHAESWWLDKGNKVPKRNTKEYDKMYESWISFAFEDIDKRIKKYHKKTHKR